MKTQMNKSIIHLCIHSFFSSLFVGNATFIIISMFYNSTMKRFRTKFCSEQIGNVSEIKLIALCLVFFSLLFQALCKEGEPKGEDWKSCHGL
jgi:hypothetical protein